MFLVRLRTSKCIQRNPRKYIQRNPRVSCKSDSGETRMGSKRFIHNSSTEKTAANSTEKTAAWYKITNQTECHQDFQYQDGLNVLEEPFNDDPKASCCPGGLYFTNAKNIFKFIEYGCYLREITLPLTDPDFKMLKDPEGDKWRANKIILGNKYDLFALPTIQMLIEKGAHVRICYERILRGAAELGKLDIVKYLENDVNIRVSYSYAHESYNYALRGASKNGHLEIVKFLHQKNANIHSHYNNALILACANGHFEIVKYLVEHGANIHTDNNALRYASYNKHFEIVKYLVEKGVIYNKADGLKIK